MIVTRENFESVTMKLSSPGHLALDTETTGLWPYAGDRLFSIIIADQEESYYFNWNKNAGDKNLILTKAHLKKLQNRLFSRFDICWFIHNAKFDMGILANEGIEILGEIHCTMAMGRVVNNDRFNYDLDSLGTEIGLSKDKTVDQYFKKEKLKSYVEIPFPMMSEYGMQDGKVGFHLGLHQREKIIALSENCRPNLEPVSRIYENEKRLTKTCFNMERTGIKVDRDYCLKASAYEKEKMREAAEKYCSLADVPEFTDSGKAHVPVFEKLGLKFKRTAKGNPSFSDDNLEGIDHPIVECIRQYRKAQKRDSAYYRNFLHYADQDGILHANVRQGGARSGRMSYSNPSLQNVPKRGEDSAEMPVRRSFVPRSGPFVMMDFDQMEYRVMLDYAKEMGIIEQVLSGVDVHTATAEMMGVTRFEAKTINFMLLYGGGAAKLAIALGCSLSEAKRLKNLYFRRLPRVAKWLRKVTQAAERRGYVVNRFGRISYFNDRNFAYKAPNYLIQGGCADVIKFAMNRIDDFLTDKKSRMLLQIHDELLFEFDESEFDLVPKVREIMESVYPSRHLPLTVGVDHSYKSWADKVEGPPNAKTA